MPQTENPDLQHCLRAIKAFTANLVKEEAYGRLSSSHFDAATRTLSLPSVDYSSHEVTDKDLSALSAVVHIKGNLVLQGNKHITALKGLENLQTISGDFILSDTSLKNIEGLDSLVRVEGAFAANNNRRLRCISGFRNLQIIARDFQIENNPVLSSIEGFSSLREVGKGSLEIVSNKELKQIQGFESLETVAGSVRLDLCPNLSDIKFLANVENVRDIVLHKIRVSDPNPLRNIFARNTDFTGMIKITSCAMPHVLFMAGLRSVGSSLFLHNNQLSDLKGLEELTRVGASLSLSGNKLRELNQLMNLREIGGMLGLSNNQLRSLHGLENLKKVTTVKWNNTYRSISIQGNTSLQDVQALENIRPDGGHLIITADNREYQVKPRKGTPFYQNSIELVDFKSQQAMPCSCLCENPYENGEELPQRRMKILFANSWYNALNNCRWLAPHFSDFSSVDSVLLYCKRNGIRTVLANVYRAQVFLAENENELKEFGLQFLAGKKNALDCMIQKKRFHDFMSDNNMSDIIPRLYLSAEEIRYPCIVKPKLGGAGRGIRLVDSAEDLGNIGNDYDIFEYIPGNEEYATSLLYKDGVILKHISYKKSFLKEYYIFQQEIPANITVTRCETQFVELFCQILDLLHQKQGNCTCSINYKIVDGPPKIFEINPRLGYTLACRPSDFKEMVEAYIGIAENDR